MEDLKEDVKSVGCFRSHDELCTIHIDNLLTSHGIGSIIFGGRFNGIVVLSARAEQATASLRADALKLGYGVRIGDDDVVPRKPKKILSRIRVATALKEPDYSSKTVLGRFLRSKEIAHLVSKYHCIVSLTVREQKYLATPKTFKVGYNLELKLQESLRKRSDGFRGSYQVRDGGLRINFLGGNEWMYDKKKNTRPTR